jgi:hypothetical protein
MRHRQYYIDELAASGRELPLVGGDLIVVRYPENRNLDWELVARTREEQIIDAAPYDLFLAGPEGIFTGPAILVRSDGRSHVFRGAGELGGFDEADFA